MELTQGQTVVYGAMMIIFTIINWVIYHKMFEVAYFGNPFKGILRELGGCVIVAMIETSIIITVLGNVLSFLFNILVKYVIPFVLAVIGLIILFVIYCKVKEWWEEKNTGMVSHSTHNTLNYNAEPQVEVVNAANQIKNIIGNYVKNYPEKNEDEVIKEFLGRRGLKIEMMQKASANTEENSAKKIFCSHCGKQILSTQKFCNFCGGKVNLPS